MKKSALLLPILVVSNILALGQALTPADREKGDQYLQQTRDGVIAAVKGLSDAQMKFKPAPDRWSVAEVLEHIALVEDGLFQRVTENVMKGPAPAADHDVAKMDALVLAALPDRSHKAKAPDRFVPTGRWTPAESLEHFEKSRARTVAYLDSTPDLRAHVGDSPFGPLDGYEWILFMAGHSERHTKQIEEVKADPNFPKN